MHSGRAGQGEARLQRQSKIQLQGVVMDGYVLAYMLPCAGWTAGIAYNMCLNSSFTGALLLFRQSKPQ